MVPGADEAAQTSQILGCPAFRFALSVAPTGALTLVDPAEPPVQPGWSAEGAAPGARSGGVVDDRAAPRSPTSSGHRRVGAAPSHPHGSSETASGPGGPDAGTDGADDGLGVPAMCDRRSP